MQKLITEYHKDLMLTLIVLSVGVCGCMVDIYNVERDVFPRIPMFSFLDVTPQEKELPLSRIDDILIPQDKDITLNGIWGLFMIFGIMLFYVTLFDIKSPILIYGIPILLFYHIKLKMLEGKIELYEYLIKEE